MRERPGQPGGSGRKRDPGCAARARRAPGASVLRLARAPLQPLVPGSLPGVGVVRSRDARRLGASGPAARASGLEDDARTASPELAYDAFEPALQNRALGDVQGRLEQRHLELEQSFELLETLLDRPFEPSAAENGSAARQLGAARVESPRGATLCVVERDGDRVARVHLRTGSYANWPVVAHAAAGNMLPDFPLINKSFELCYACADR